MASVQRRYDDDLIWQAMREAGLSIDDVQVKGVSAYIDDDRPGPYDATFQVTFQWVARHDIALQILERARALEAEHPVAEPSSDGFESFQ